MTTKDFDVIILGGGITGAGTQRDCAMRGLRTLLIERSDIATGATGRNHGLLHSGARYAVNDAESAEECIRENMILRKIASHCIDETDGLFITLPEDDLAYQQTFVEACRKAGINAEIIDPKLAVRLDPAVNPALTGAVRVPDGSVDPFRLCAANMLDAKLHDGQVRLHTEVTGFIREGDTILGVRTRNLQTGETEEFRAPRVPCWYSRTGSTRWSSTGAGNRRTPISWCRAIRSASSARHPRTFLSKNATMWL